MDMANGGPWTVVEETPAEQPQQAGPISTAVAKGLTAVVHMASKHPGSDGYNEHNSGLGLRVEDGDNYYQAGAYKNSVGEVSKYAGVGKRLWHAGPLEIGASAGLVTGYPDLPIAPYIIPEVGLNLGKAKVLVNYIPKFKSGDMKVDPAIGLSIGIPLK